MPTKNKSTRRAKRFRMGSAAAWAFAALSAAAPPARAAERLTLANGLDLICHHHAVVDGRMRVFLKADGADYFELNPEAVTGVETVPDPVADSKPEIAQAGAAQSPRAASKVASGPAATARSLDARLTPEDLHQLLSKAGAEHNVNEDLLASLVKAESGGYIRAVSRTGARGLMQLMPGTARQLGVSDSFAPDQNVRGGTAYLDALLTRYHDNIALALAAYNAGPGAVDRYRGIPPYRETQAYVARVVHEFNRRVLARRNTLRIAAANPTFTAAGAEASSEQSATNGNPGTGRD